jgi:MurNAc alpha-1-phosphate uridylyltransferase
MKAMIFAAGLGTRFKPWTDRHPKALAMVNGKPLLQRNIEYLQRHGITEVVVNVHHFADQIEDAVQKNKGWGSRITISDERGEVLETGGGLMKAAHLLEDEAPFLTLNVDILTDLDIGALLAFHRTHRPLISFGVSNRPSSRNFLMDADNRLCGWANYQTGERKIAVDHNPLFPKAYSCVAVFEQRVFSCIRQRGKFSLTETYLDLAAEHLIMGFEHSGEQLVDVGRPESVAVAEKYFQ